MMVKCCTILIENKIIPVHIAGERSVHIKGLKIKVLSKKPLRKIQRLFFILKELMLNINFGPMIPAGSNQIIF